MLTSQRGGDMGRIVLVRHGQTEGFPGGSYTDLSPRGREQATALGAWWRGRPVPAVVVAGPRERQQQTAALVADGLGWPDPLILPSLDEHHGKEVFVGALESAQRGDEAARAAVAGFGDSPAASLRAFRRVMIAWAMGDLRAAAPVESWHAFRARADEAAATLRTYAEAGEVVAFTSAGLIGSVAARALGVSSEADVMRLTFAVDNTSLTELRAGKHLHRFNAVPHLNDPDLITAV